MVGRDCPSSSIWSVQGGQGFLRDFDIIAAAEYIGSFNDRLAERFLLISMRISFFRRRRFVDVFDSIQTNKNNHPFPTKKKEGITKTIRIYNISLYTHFTTFSSYAFTTKNTSRYCIGLTNPFQVNISSTKSVVLPSYNTSNLTVASLWL